MSEEEALKIAFELFVDVTDGRPTPEEAEAANIIKRMYQARKKSREQFERNPDHPCAD